VISASVISSCLKNHRYANISTGGDERQGYKLPCRSLFVKEQFTETTLSFAPGSTISLRPWTMTFSLKPLRDD